MGWRRVPESKRSGPCPGQEDEGEVRAGPQARLPPTPEGQCEDAARLQGPIPPITPSPGTSVCTSVNRTPIAHRTLPDRPRNCPHSSPPFCCRGFQWNRMGPGTPRGSYGVVWEETHILSHPGPRPPWLPLGTQETPHGQHVLPSCALPAATGLSRLWVHEACPHPGPLHLSFVCLAPSLPISTEHLAELVSIQMSLSPF